MSRPRKPPAFLVDATIGRSPKLAQLPSDTARLGVIYAVLAGAKLAEPPGRFASRAHFREVGGRFARFLGAYLTAGILEEAPKLCARCALAWAKDPSPGALVVHDWRQHQYDPRKVERQREYEERQKAGQSDAVSDANSDGVSDGFLARGRTRPDASNVERRTSNVERRTGIQGRNPTARARALSGLVDPLESRR